MNQKIMIGIVVILILAAGGYYWMKMRPTAPGVPQTTQQAQKEASQWAAAIKSGTPTTCTMTKDTEKLEYLIKGKKMRTNMTIPVENKTTLAHMINDEQYFYMWTEGESNGTKMSATSASPSPAASTQAPNRPSTPDFDTESGFDDLTTQGYSINCVSGSIDEAQFVPPSNVNFVDPASLMQQVAPQGAGGQLDMQKIQELQKQYGGTTPADQ